MDKTSDVFKYYNLCLDDSSAFHKVDKVFDRAYHEVKNIKLDSTIEPMPIYLRQRNLSFGYKELIDKINHINSHYDPTDANLNDLLEYFKTINFKSIHSDQKITIIFDAVVNMCKFID